ncbi:MAG: PD40 domain-containing protein [Pyrinomonadaceae bacterium]|nr:PD40 domain-containing protein [Pyrinomonadaceae bacterium]
MALLAVCIALWRYLKSQASAPDGKSFVYASRANGNWDLYLQRVGGRNTTLLTPDTTSDESQPAFSPNGGGEPVVMTKDATTNWNPVWSPDGKFLYFASDRSGNMSFWRVPIDEETGKVLGEPDAVMTPSTFNRHLRFSRDGRRMLYVQTSQQSNIRAVSFDPKREKVVGEPFWVTRGDRQISRPEACGNFQRSSFRRRILFIRGAQI